MKIRIKNRQRKIIINEKKIINLARKVLKNKGIPQAELGILFVGRERMRSLNKKFRKADRATDVLAFGVHEEKSAPFGQRIHPEILGDVVICPEFAQAAASIYNTNKEYEIYLYLIHGILHLLGFNDSDVKQRLRMQKEEKQILKKLCKGKI